MTDLVERLRGIYRIPITDGLGPAGGDEPGNASEFVRRFEVPPIQREAADEIERLRSLIEPDLMQTYALLREVARDRDDARVRIADAIRALKEPRAAANGEGE